MRDSQRQRVYTAESLVYDHKRMTLEQCQQWVDEVVGSAWWAHRSSRRKITVTTGARGGRAWASADTIRTSPSSRNKWTMLHELAHHLTTTGAPHGPEFCANVVALTRQFMGKAQGDALKQAFRDHRVKVRGTAKAKVRRVQCARCRKTISERGAWKVSLGYGHWFCTKRCGEDWLKAHLVKN